MYLKQIEIHGFKSFANDTILTFEKGITGIVGPNGSGKSNIADAVRWVLGERSMKQLRGAETLDVIFSGTELRKAQSFAYVSLLIDNSDKKLPLDYEEVEVSRRLYRNGESEYKINNVECRLKDISEIFFDTGIGKEGYSIIGQGQIDKILSNKPEDRRELFDEAVGIVKYKRRKAIAEKKLEDEKLNLSRVSDIINEIERQIGPLKKQAEAAKEYLNMKDDLLLYESNYFIREVDNESKIIDDINTKITENKNKLKQVSDKRHAFNEKYNEIEKQITKIDLEISDIKDKISESSSLKENLKGQVNVLKEQINSETGNMKGRNDRIESLDLTIKNLVIDIEKDYHTLLALKNQIEFIKNNNTEIDEDENKFTNDLNLISNNLSKVDDVFKSNKDYDFNFKNNDNKNSDIFTSGVFNNDVNDNRNKLNEIDAKIDEKKNEINSLNDLLVNNNTKLEEINTSLMETQNIFHSEETKLETIKNMLERYEGYINTVKIVLDNKKLFSGMKGAVADLIETNKKYEVAVEIALGNAIQYIVTDSTDSSKKIISYLKTNKLGRVTTLPLSALSVKDNDIYNEAKKEKGVIDIAVNLVKYEKEYKLLADYLLSRCLVVDNFDNAKSIFKKYESGIKLVTLEGELFNPGGAIAGGAFKNSSNLIGRKREYEEIKVSLSDLKDKIDNLILNKTRVSEDYDSTYNAIEKIKEEINELNIEKNTATLNIINGLKLQYSNISNKTLFTIENLNKLIDSFTLSLNEKNKYVSEDSGFSINIKEKENKIKELENSIIELDNKLHDFETEIEEKNKEKSDNLANRKEYYESKDAIMTEQIKLEQESNTLSNSIEKANQKIEEITSTMLENYNLTYAIAKEKYKEDIGDISELKLKVKEKRKIIQDLGPININAIEEYENVGKRYDIMTTQYDDIKKSEEMIADIVMDLDKNMREQFETNFKRIKDEFEIVFKELFGGGKANLELVETDEKGELDAGVSIVVQPPGKKLSNMMQLSGGEKALTAIALLFAIQNLKPSPFCLLDEIEAALDESNVDRFADYLKNLTNETQFILITHRRGTMEKADRLYGITMQEKGVTALVSVDLIEDQLT